MLAHPRGTATVARGTEATPPPGVSGESGDEDEFMHAGPAARGYCSPIVATPEQNESLDSDEEEFMHKQHVKELKLESEEQLEQREMWGGLSFRNEVDLATPGESLDSDEEEFLRSEQSVRAVATNQSQLEQKEIWGGLSYRDETDLSEGLVATPGEHESLDSDEEKFMRSAVKGREQEARGHRSKAQRPVWPGISFRDEADISTGSTGGENSTPPWVNMPTPSPVARQTRRRARPKGKADRPVERSSAITIANGGQDEGRVHRSARGIRTFSPVCGGEDVNGKNDDGGDHAKIRMRMVSPGFLSEESDEEGDVLSGLPTWASVSPPQYFDTEAAVKAMKRQREEQKQRMQAYKGKEKATGGREGTTMGEGYESLSSDSLLALDTLVLPVGALEKRRPDPPEQRDSSEDNNLIGKGALSQPREKEGKEEEALPREMERERETVPDVALLGTVRDLRDLYDLSTKELVELLKAAYRALGEYRRSGGKIAPRNVREMEFRARTLEQERDAAQQGLSEREERLSHMEADNALLQNSLYQREDELRSRDRVIREWQKNFDQVCSERDELKKKVERTKEQFVQYQHTFERHMIRVAQEMYKSVRAQSSTLDDLGQQLRVAKGALVTKTEEVSALDKKVASLTREVERKECNLLELSEHMRELTRRCKLLEVHKGVPADLRLDILDREKPLNFAADPVGETKRKEVLSPSEGSKDLRSSTARGEKRFQTALLREEGRETQASEGEKMITLAQKETSGSPLALAVEEKSGLHEATPDPQAGKVLISTASSQGKELVEGMSRATSLVSHVAHKDESVNKQDTSATALEAPRLAEVESTEKAGAAMCAQSEREKRSPAKLVADIGDNGEIGVESRGGDQDEEIPSRCSSPVSVPTMRSHSPADLSLLLVTPPALASGGVVADGECQTVTISSDVTRAAIPESGRNAEEASEGREDSIVLGEQRRKNSGQSNAHLPKGVSQQDKEVAVTSEVGHTSPQAVRRSLSKVGILAEVEDFAFSPRKATPPEDGRLLLLSSDKTAASGGSRLAGFFRRRGKSFTVTPDADGTETLSVEKPLAAAAAEMERANDERFTSGKEARAKFLDAVQAAPRPASRGHRRTASVTVGEERSTFATLFGRQKSPFRSRVGEESAAATARGGSGAGRGAVSEKQQVDLEAQIQLLRSAAMAHQAHSSMLSSQIVELEREHGAKLLAKDRQVQDLQQQIAELRTELVLSQKVEILSIAQSSMDGGAEDSYELFLFILSAVKVSLGSDACADVNMESLYEQVQALPRERWFQYLLSTPALRTESQGASASRREGKGEGEEGCSREVHTQGGNAKKDLRTRSYSISNLFRRSPHKQ